MKIQMKPETERLLREELLRGAFQSVDDLIAASVLALRGQDGTLEATIGSELSGKAHSDGEEKGHRFAEWARNHPDTPPLPVEAISRQSLNPDRW